MGLFFKNPMIPHPLRRKRGAESGHGRQMTSSQRRTWRSDLAKSHKASLEAPSWLWSSVVELIGLHEAAYLDHCRRFALPAAA